MEERIAWSAPVESLSQALHRGEGDFTGGTVGMTVLCVLVLALGVIYFLSRRHDSPEDDPEDEG